MSLTSALVQKMLDADGRAQKTIAAEVDCAPATISNWRTGARSPSMEDLSDLAEVLGFRLILEVVRPDETPVFLGETEEELLESVRELANTDSELAPMITTSLLAQVEEWHRLLEE